MSVDKMIVITKVVSRNFIVDLVARIQNMFGANLSGYEKMVNKAISQVIDEILEKGYDVKWFRYEITQLTNGAVSVTYYGELK